MANKVLEVKNLSKVYKGSGYEVTALDKVSFELKNGELLGYILLNCKILQQIKRLKDKTNVIPSIDRSFRFFKKVICFFTIKNNFTA